MESEARAMLDEMSGEFTRGNELGLRLLIGRSGFILTIRAEYSRCCPPIRYISLEWFGIDAALATVPHLQIPRLGASSRDLRSHATLDSSRTLNLKIMA